MDKLQERVLLSYAAALEHGRTSSKKLIPMHKYYSELITDFVGKERNILSFSLGINDGKEKNVIRRNRDLYVIEKGEENGIIVEFRSTLSNLNQNKYNYLSEAIGDASIAKQNGYHYILIYEIPKQVPYFDNNGVIKGFEATGAFVKNVINEVNDAKSQLCRPTSVYFSIYEFTNIDEGVLIGKTASYYLDYIVKNAGVKRCDILNQLSNGDTVIVNDEKSMLAKINTTMDSVRSMRKYSAYMAKIGTLSLDQIEKIIENFNL